MKEDKDPKQAGLHTDAKVKKGRVHMHVGKPAEHLFPKAIRALAPWAPKAEAVSPAQILDLLSHDPRGGTDFDVPILAALDFVEKQDAFRKADVVLVTDAEIGTDGAPASRARADKVGATVYGILIGRRGAAALKAYCHDVAAIDDVSRDTAATDLVFSKI